MNWKHWLRGLISSVAGAVSGPLTLTVVDSKHQHDWDVLLSLLGVGSIVGLLSYLTKHPLPDDEDTQQ